jgi:hypothetical protein
MDGSYKKSMDNIESNSRTFFFSPEILRGYSGWLYEVKGKAIPLQVSTGPEGSRRLRLPDFNPLTVNG